MEIWQSRESKLCVTEFLRALPIYIKVHSKDEKNFINRFVTHSLVNDEVAICFIVDEMTVLFGKDSRFIRLSYANGGTLNFEEGEKRLSLAMNEGARLMFAHVFKQHGKVLAIPEPEQAGSKELKFVRKLVRSTLEHISLSDEERNAYEGFVAFLEKTVPQELELTVNDMMISVTFNTLTSDSFLRTYNILFRGGAFVALMDDGGMITKRINREFLVCVTELLHEAGINTVILCAPGELVLNDDPAHTQELWGEKGVAADVLELFIENTPLTKEELTCITTFKDELTDPYLILRPGRLQIMKNIDSTKNFVYFTLSLSEGGKATLHNCPSSLKSNLNEKCKRDIYFYLKKYGKENWFS